MAPMMPRLHAAVHSTLLLFVRVHEHEVTAVVGGFTCLFSLLASYFALLPLREDAGISLGTSNLPRLFIASLVATVIFTPAASAFLSRATGWQRERALRQFFTAMACVLLVFFALYNATAVEQLIGRSTSNSRQLPLHQSALDTPALVTPQLQQQQQQQQQQLQIEEHQQHTEKQLVLQQQQIHMQEANQQQQQQRRRMLSLLPDNAAAVPPQFGATGTRRLQQLRERRALTSAEANAAPGGAAESAAPAGAPAAARKSTVTARDGDPSLNRAQRLLRAALYVWSSIMNLVGISSVWARCADSFSPEAGARLFGFISAGATLGQLAGSVVALFVARAAQLTAASGAGTPQPASVLILVAALLQLAAAHLVCAVRPPTQTATADKEPLIPALGGSAALLEGESVGRTSSALLRRRLSIDAAENGIARRVGSATTAVPAAPAARLPPGLPGGTAACLVGFRTIAGSRYLILLCANLLLTYLVGSIAYFQRALAVSGSLRDGATRTFFFARVNAACGCAVLAAQLLASGSVLRALGVRVALGGGPAVCVLGITAVALAPGPGVVAAFEVARKVYGYGVVRPAREVLFTVLSRDEVYCAKLLIDTVVQRAGDALAAAAFQLLDVRLQLGQAGVGAAGCAACVAWLLTANQLGRQHAQLTRSR